MKITEGTKVKHIITQKILTVLSERGFLKDGKVYIPCADENNMIDDYCKDDLYLFSGENIYLKRLKEQYEETFKGSMDDRRLRKRQYYSVRVFCLDCELLSFNDIEVMEDGVKSSFHSFPADLLP